MGWSGKKKNKKKKQENKENEEEKDSVEADDDEEEEEAKEEQKENVLSLFFAVQSSQHISSYSFLEPKKLPVDHFDFPCASTQPG